MAGAQPRIVFRTAGHETILSMVRAGIGWAVLPWLALHAHDAFSDEQLGIRPLKPSPSRSLALYRPAGRTGSPLAVRAREIALDVARDLARRM
ncbi:LysR family transcriptional regulator substrate-binding protein [Amycolatopsis sp. NPDC049688]|uniref:LysR family transcriptional regulator substrate-binding protein n=1 Tax=Amycolatopsis sp. NPDC049688 TaxID=3154733 RepID=UPI0034486835